MTLLTNTAGSTQANGTVVSTTNSGDPTAFTDVSNTEITYQSGAAYSGALGFRHAATSGVASYVGWTGVAGATTDCALRFYLRLAALPGAASRVAGVRSTGGGTGLGTVQVNTDGKLSIGSDVSGSVVGTSAAALSVNTWYRVEVSFSNPTTTTGTATLRAYLGDTTTVAASIDVSAANFGAAVAQGTARFGRGQTTANAWTFDMDELAFQTGSTTFIGPATVGAGYRASAAGNNGQTATGSSFPITIPATAQVGDVAVITLVSNNLTVTTPTPTGWTLVSGPDRSTNSSGWLFEKTLASGEPGSTITVTMSTASWVNAVIDVYSGVTTAGRLTATAIDTASDNTADVPSLAGVPAGALVHISYARRSGAATAPDVTVAAPYTATGVRAASANSATINVSTEGSYLVAASAGAYGGGTTAVNQANVGLAYALAYPEVADTTAPSVPTGVTATADSATQVTVSWSASTDAVGVTSYRVRRGGVDLTGATAVAGTSFIDTTASPSTAYSYTVSAVDAAGNRSAESTAATATTPAAGDTTAPTVPTGVTATANSGTSVTIAWAASTDAVGVTSYRVRRGGVDVAGATAVVGTTFTDTSAAGGATYSYTVSARDAAGNRSAESTAATVTTPAGLPVNETWTGANGALWPAGWTATNGALTNGGLSIQGNRGAITPTIASYQQAGAYHAAVASNVDLTTTFRLTYGGVIGFRDRRINIGLRTGTAIYPDRSDLPLVGYVLKLYMHPDYEGGWYLATLHKFDGSASTVDPQVPPPGQGGWLPTIVENVDYRVRIQLVGDRCRARVWRADTVEPQTWIVDWQDFGVPLPAGHTWLGVETGWDGGNGTDPQYRFDDLAVVDGSGLDLTPVPPAPTPVPERPPLDPPGEPRRMTVSLYRGSYQRIGQVPDYVSCSVSWEHNAVGSGELVVGEDDPIAPYLLTVDQQVIEAVIDIGDLRWSGRVASALLERDGPPGSGRITATLVEDWAWLLRILASQKGASPSLTAMPQFDARTGPMATLAADYINVAATRMGLPVVCSKPTTDTSPTLSLRARMTVLADLLAQPMADAGVSLSARVWLPTDPQPPDLTTTLTTPTVVFRSRVLADKPWLQWTDAMSNIVSLDFQVFHPSAYRVVLGLAGEDAARVYDQYIDASRQSAIGPFGFPEVYTDATDATLGTQSQEAGRLALREHLGGVSAAFEIADADPWVLGEDYVVGDMATVAVNGLSWRQRITQATATDDREDGFSVSTVVGEASLRTRGQDMMVRALARVAAGLRTVQSRR